MRNTFVDIHIIQTVPPSNVNRDDTGSPKSAMYGGVRRARVSSQSWKRATRLAFAEMLDRSELGVRTKRVVELVAEEISRQNSSLAMEAVELASAALTAGGIKLSKPRQAGRDTEEAAYLIFLSRRQVVALAEAAIESTKGGDGAKIDRSTVKAILQANNSIDLALFGRMVADVSDLSLDASARVAHAISVHAVDNEYDYFTAVDEVKENSAESEDSGAGMIGTVEFNSSTLYRYATVDVSSLAASLGDLEATVRAVEAFVSAFSRSMPTGKLNTFANRTLPDAVLAVIRRDQPISLVGAFEEPVVGSTGGGRVTQATSRLAEYAAQVNAAFGDGGAEAWVAGVGVAADPLELVAERTSFEHLVEAVGQRVASGLAEGR